MRGRDLTQELDGVDGILSALVFGASFAGDVLQDELIECRVAVIVVGERDHLVRDVGVRAAVHTPNQIVEDDGIGLHDFFAFDGHEAWAEPSGRRARSMQLVDLAVVGFLGRNRDDDGERVLVGHQNCPYVEFAVMLPLGGRVGEVGAQLRAHGGPQWVHGVSRLRAARHIPLFFSCQGRGQHADVRA